MINAAPNILIENADLKALVAKQAQQIDQLAQQVDNQNALNTLLEEQIRLLRANTFGPRSEAMPTGQGQLFNEAEFLADEAAAEAAEEDTIEVPAHRRKRGGRKPLPENLPRQEIIHDLPDDEKVCPHDQTPLKHIGDEVSEQLEIIPQQARVIRHIRRKYACPCCDESLVTAPMPPQPIPKSLATPATLAFIVTSKFVDGLPLHRLERVFNRLDIEISRQTLARWVIRCGVLVQVLINLLQDQLLDGALIHMDETRLQVLNEPGRPATSQSNIWVQRGGPPDQPIILFHYDPSRSAAVATRLLDGFSGALVTDGYEGYAASVRTHQLTHAGCWAHARRKFDEAVKAQTPKGKKPKAGKATRGLSFIRKLYRVERLANNQDLSPEQRLAFRQQHAQPIMDELGAWLQTSLSQVPPKSAIGKALSYLNNQWGKLTVYLDDGHIPIDNNPAENAIRPFVIGRKAWLFADTVAGAEASANLYGLVETAKANGLEPYRYLRYVFTHLPAADTLEAFEALLPTRVDCEITNALPL